MNKSICTQIKESVPCYYVAEMFGCEIRDKRGRNKYQIHALWREDKHASALYNESENLIYDFTSGKIVDVITLYSLLSGKSIAESIKDLAELMKNLDVEYKATLASYTQKHVKLESPFIIHDIRTIQDPDVLKYIFSRKVSLTATCQLCKEVVYSHKDYPQYINHALGFQNNLGSWEISMYNPYVSSSKRKIKYCLGQKAVSYINQNGVNRFGNKILIVTEGFINMLSVMSLYGWNTTNADMLVLNSTALTKEGIRIIKESNIKYDEVYYLLDWDTAGQKAWREMEKGLKNVIGVQINSMRGFVKKYPQVWEKNATADMNDFLIHQVSNGVLNLDHSFKLNPITPGFVGE